jgi:hypothetical protein
VSQMTFDEFVVRVPLAEIEHQATRQAQLRIPRSWETAEMSATYTGKGYIRQAKRVGFIRVDMPLDMLEISQRDIAADRQERLERINGTEDPIWVYIDRDMCSDRLIYSILDGNNRAYFRAKRGLTTIPAYVTGREYRLLYDALLRRGLLKGRVDAS